MADDRNAPATKGDIEDLRRKRKQEIGALRSDTKDQVGTIRSEMRESAAMLRSEMQHMHHDLIERARDGERRLLEAFYTFAKLNQASLAARGHESPAVKEQVAIIESKLAEVKRKDYPPQS